MKTKFFLFAFSFIALNAFSQPGNLDQSFGINGKVFAESFIGEAKTIIVQNDGKILIGGRSDTVSDNGDNAGGFLVARFNANGTPDNDFGDNGKTIIREIEGVRCMHVDAMTIQSDGKIIACGRFIITSPYGIIGIVRYNADGTIDETFGDSGFVLTSVARENIVGDMILQPDGKILITGEKKANENDNSTAFVLRYNVDGTKDASFGTDGLILTTFSAPIDIHAIGLQQDGKIIIGGEYWPVYFYQILVRYFPDGRIDSSFDGNGIAALTTANGRMYDLAIQDDGKIVIAGTSAGSMLTARFNSSSSVDSSFGKNRTGYSILPMTTGYSQASNVFLQSDKSIILTGSYYTTPGTGLGAVKFDANGIVDSSFGENGVAVSGFDLDMIAYENPGAIQPDGSIIVGASVWPENDEDFTRIGMVRFLGSNDKTPKYVKIKKWLHRHGFTWEDRPGKNISYYAVQRSGNGNNFTEIARLFNHNNQQQFSYSDAAPLTGDNYYRLAAVSADGAVEYSNILTIPNNTTTIKIYPNPAKNNLMIEGLSSNIKTKLVITDLNGVARMTTVVNSNTYNWNISNLKQGNYVLQVVVNGNNVVTKKFIKE